MRPEKPKAAAPGKSSRRPASTSQTTRPARPSAKRSPAPKQSAAPTQIEEALRLSEERFTQAFHQSPVASALVDATDFTIRDVNEALLDLTKHTREQLIGQAVAGLDIQIDPEVRASANRELQDHGKFNNKETQLRLPGGEVRYVLSSGSRLIIEGRPHNLLLFQDLTERLNTEHQVVQLQRLYATLSQVNQIIVRVKDRASLYQSICDVAVQYGGFSLAWLGLLDEATGEVKPAAATGLEVANWPFPIINIHSGDLKDGLVARSIRTSKVVTTEDVQTDAGLHTVQPLLHTFDYHSSAAIPFQLRGGTIGAISLVSAQADLFKAKAEVNLLEELGLDVSFALDTLETEAERQRAEAASREHQARYHHILDSMLEGCQVIDFNWRYVYVNRVAAQHGQRRPDELLHHTMMEVYPGIEQTELFAQLQGCLQDRLPRRLENEFVFPDGGVGWFELSIQPSPEGIFILSTEITDRKLVAMALAQNEKRFRSLIEKSSDVIALYDENGMITYVSSSVTRVLGYEVEEYVGRNAFELFHLDDQVEAAETFIPLIQRPGQSMTIQARQLHKDGSWRWLEGTATNLLAESGVQAIIANFRDITDRKQAEAALYESEEKLRLFIEHAPAALAMFDREMRYLAVSRRWMVDYGLGEQQIIGRTHYEIFPEIPDRWKLVHQRGLAGEVIRADDDSFERADGSVQWLRWEVRPWYITDQAIGGIVIFTEDITSRKQAEAQIHYQANLIENVSDAIISTDLNFVVRSWNKAAENIYGWQAEAALGHRMEDIVPIQPVKGSLEEVLQQFKANGFWKGDVVQWSRNGLPLNIYSAVSLIRDNSGSPTGVVAVNRNITERVQAEQQVQNQLQRLRALRTIDQAISSSLDIHLTLEVLLDEVITQLGVDAASVLLLDAAIQTLEYATGRGFRTEIIQTTQIRLGQGLPGRAALDRQLVNIPNLSDARRELVRPYLIDREGFVAYYGVPLIAKGAVKGVLEVFHRTALNPNPDWLDFLEALAGQAAIAIDDAQLFNSLQRSNIDLSLAYDATIEGWSHALDLRDRETEGHTQRVTEMTIRLALAAGLSESARAHIWRGSLLHDIGKMGIPDHILLKPGPLTDEEWISMRKHPVYAYELLSPISYLRPALDIPYCHHEKWDGTGYPRKLKGEQIPLAARLFAVVDIWDALGSDRPYRAAWPPDKVLDHIRSLSGTHLDPAIVELFLRVLNE